MQVITPHKDQTLQNLLSKYILGVDIKSFLDTKDPISNVTNWDRIKRKYNEDELKSNEPKYPSGNILVKAGTQLDLRVSYIKRDIPKRVIDKIHKQSEFKPFISERLSELLNDPKYFSKSSYNDGAVYSVQDTDLSIYIWCRSLTVPNSQSKGAWINVSGFASFVQTGVGASGGNFAITFPTVSCSWNESLGWIMDNVSGYDTGDIRENVHSQTSITKYDPKDPHNLKRNRFWFDTVLQENDLVYIRYEKLAMEKEGKPFNVSLSPSDIPGNVYDMIGLIDRVTLHVDANLNSNTIRVFGRDVAKLLMEDGSYFFVSQFAQNIFTDENSILTKRNRAELEAASFAAAGYTFKSVETILKFIFNKFSNIGVIENSAFSGYGDRALKSKFNLKSSELSAKGQQQRVIDKLNETFLSEPRQGLWRIIDFIFDPQIADRALADNSIYRDAGAIINTIRKICQEPFIEFYGDTYGDKYAFIIRKPPFDAKGYRGLVYKNYLTEGAETDYDPNSNSILKTGKLIHNDFESQTKIFDFPFLLDDDKIRDKARRNLENRLQGRTATISDLVIDIDDPISEPVFSYHDEVYSWYRVVPRGMGIVDETSGFQLAPAIPLDEYAEVWGNKSYELEYNYAPTQFLQDSEAQAEYKYAEQQTFYDLQFVIQSNQYLPFTRRGTIVIPGNRTIKRGLFVYYRPTNEIFYVDQVNNQAFINKDGVNRVTILTVTRGMREPYIRGKWIKFPSGEKRVSYFDIINTKVDSNATINNKEFLKNWRVDRDIFDFFLQRRQWAE